MKTVTVFDKPMCCSSGVCGPSVDPVLVRFAEDVRWLTQQGVKITRHNPAQDAHAFLLDPVVREAMQGQGEAALPVVVVDGEEKSRRRYPERDELAAWAGIGQSNNQEDPHDKDAPCSGTECC